VPRAADTTQSSASPGRGGGPTPFATPVRARVLAALGLVILGTGAGMACARDSYLVVTLSSADDTPFTAVTAVDVTVSGVAGHDPKTLPTYVPTMPLTFGRMAADGRVRFSVAFTPDVVGKVTLQVTVSSDVTPCLGYGEVHDVTIARGGTQAVAVQIQHTDGTCPAGTQLPDGGLDGAGDGAAGSDADGPPSSQLTFPGCDPTVTTPGACAAGESCFVDCDSKVARCVPAGTSGPGQSCVTANDCMVGSQCFDLSARPGCAPRTQVCLPFCANDTQCAASTGAAPLSDAASPPFRYPGGSCATAVECTGALMTTYKTCTFACDPRGDATSGCPTGLLCFLFHRAAGGDAPDCGCREPTRTGADGTTCVSSASCQPGFVCNESNGALACRRLCLVTSPTPECGTKVCTPLSTNPTFGVCL